MRTAVRQETGVRPLVARSIDVIRDGQAPSGAYLACPAFEQYRYCWFRDGSFTADAMSRVGEVASAEAFFGWAARVLLARADAIRARQHPHTRYTAAGEEADVAWPTFQLDGFGLLLWATREHAERHDRRDRTWDELSSLLTGYLAATWRTPCTDWWEERKGVHVVTLGCIWAGLAAWSHPAADDVLAAVAAHDDAPLDASLLALETPLGVRRVELSCFEPLVSPGGGVHRHLEDTYYGGGEWLLLTALLGWARARQGDLDGARDALAWVAAHATSEGFLPEQSQDHLLAPGRFAPWVERWGDPPCPLLWSHAMFLSLAHELGETP